MKIFKFTIIVLLISSSAAIASGKNLKALLGYKSFYSAQTGPYIETYLSVSGQSVVFKQQPGGKYQAAIEVMLLFRLGEEIKFADKYNLLSPEASNVDEVDFNFLDQKRISLANGTYVLELSVRDINLEGSKPFKSNREVIIDYHPNTVAVSDIQLVDSYTPVSGGEQNATSKNGYDIIPYVDNYFGQDKTSLKFYAEIYNTSKVLGSDPFLISYHIESFEKGRIMPKYRGFSRRESNELSVLLGEFPIGELGSGNYNIVVEARNKENEIIAFRSCFFQRNNGPAPDLAEDDIRYLDVSNTFVAAFTDKDTLAEYISSLQPIASAKETMFLHNQLKLADEQLMQQFLYDFWARRNPGDPEGAFHEYDGQVSMVNREFGTLSKQGYETDRGRVFLQYGNPNKMIRSYNEPSAYPYEIWHYYKTGTQTNKKFVFYNRDLVTNDFALIHSNAIGEINDNQWQLKLHKRDLQTNDLDRDYEINSMGSFGNKVNSEWENH